MDKFKELDKVFVVTRSLSTNSGFPTYEISEDRFCQYRDEKIIDCFDDDGMYWVEAGAVHKTKKEAIQFILRRLNREHTWWFNRSLEIED